MIDDGVKAQGLEEDAVRVADISIHLVEALEAGTSEAQSDLRDTIDTATSD